MKIKCTICNATLSNCGVCHGTGVIEWLGKWEELKKWLTMMDKYMEVLTQIKRIEKWEKQAYE